MDHTQKFMDFIQKSFSEIKVDVILENSTEIIFNIYTLKCYSYWNLTEKQKNELDQCIWQIRWFCNEKDFPNEIMCMYSYDEEVTGNDFYVDYRRYK